MPTNSSVTLFIIIGVAIVSLLILILIPTSFSDVEYYEVSLCQVMILLQKSANYFNSIQTNINSSIHFRLRAYLSALITLSAIPYISLTDANRYKKKKLSSS